MGLTIARASTSANRSGGARIWLVGLGVGAVLAVAASSVSAAEFTAEQRRAIEAIVRDYLTKNPEVMLDVLQAAEDKLKSESREKASAALAAHHEAVFSDPNAPVGGNPKGDVTLVEFFDYRCPYCKQVEPALEKLLDDDHKLRLVYKEFPILGPESMTAAQAALAAHRQSKYAEFHRAMMAFKGQVDDDSVIKVAASVGLNVDRLKRDMEAPEIDSSLKANIALAEALDIRGTPGFVIGDKIVPGAIGLESLKRLIASQREK